MFILRFPPSLSHISTSCLTFPEVLQCKNLDLCGNCLVVQWLGLCHSLLRTQVQSLVGELRSWKLQGSPQNKTSIWIFERAAAAAAAAAKLQQSCPTLCDPIDYSLPGSSVHGIFQARVLEWGAIAFSALKESPVVSLAQDTTTTSWRWRITSPLLYHSTVGTADLHIPSWAWTPFPWPRFRVGYWGAPWTSPLLYFLKSAMAPIPRRSF